MTLKDIGKLINENSQESSKKIRVLESQLSFQIVQYIIKLQ